MLTVYGFLLSSGNERKCNIDKMLVFQNARYDEKDVIIGTNLDEGTFWILYSVDGLSKDNTSELTYDQYLQAVDLVNWDLTPQQVSLTLHVLYL